jgi:hypothetical protein
MLVDDCQGAIDPSVFMRAISVVATKDQPTA